MSFFGFSHIYHIFHIIVISFSELGKLLREVSQGPILGSLLFLPYINDIPQPVKCEFLFYSDKTCQIF